GLGINDLGSIPRVLELIDLDYAIVAMPYTLLDQPALDDELPLCAERGVSVVIGAVFASGALAVDRGEGTYNYERAPERVRARVAGMRAVCDRHDVSLAAVALQFPFGHPAVAAVIPGALSAAQVRQNVERFDADVPPALWDELKAEGLLRTDAPTPGAVDGGVR
ncbi:MAG: aldo/keto reductase, partial [Gaiella sp.]